MSLWRKRLNKMGNQWRCWIPVLNVQDARKSASFYCEFLGFRQDWEHQFGDGFPLYISVSRDALTLHLSEHGDRVEHVTLVISVEDVDAVYSELWERGLEPAAPPEDRPYGVREFSFSDLDGHILVVSKSLSNFEMSPGRVMNENDI